MIYRSYTPSVELPGHRSLGAYAQVLGALLAAVLLLRTGAQTPSVPQLYGYTMIKEYPHDPDAFTQGLDFDRNATLEFFWESTGMPFCTCPQAMCVLLGQGRLLTVNAAGKDVR